MTAGSVTPSCQHDRSVKVIEKNCHLRVLKSAQFVIKSTACEHPRKRVQRRR